MNSAELNALAHVMQAIAAGAEWECQWADGWGHPNGRDLEFCLGKRIPVRIKGEVSTAKVDDGGPAFPRPSGPRQEGYGPQAQRGMTLRQYAAIELRVPNSGIDWLDDMIRQSQLDHATGQALNGILSNACLIELHEDYKLAAKAAFHFAAATIARSHRKEGA